MYFCSLLKEAANIMFDTENLEQKRIRNPIKLLRGRNTGKEVDGGGLLVDSHNTQHIGLWAVSSQL